MRVEILFALFNLPKIIILLIFTIFLIIFHVEFVSFSSPCICLFDVLPYFLAIFTSKDNLYTNLKVSKQLSLIILRVLNISVLDISAFT